MTMRLITGKNYRAKVTLSALEALFSNSVIESKLRSAGFQKVSDTGTGKAREAVGQWNGQSQSVEIPSQLSDVKEV